jgi:superfamily II DNA helicase RecQ
VTLDIESLPPHSVEFWVAVCSTTPEPISRSRFFDLLRQLAQAGKVAKSVVDEKWAKSAFGHPNLER